MFTIRYSVREQGRDESYRPLVAQDLSIHTEQTGGTGVPDDPYQLRITVRNTGENAWHGILRLDVSFASELSGFFLPGFMYGTNRGDAPLETSSKAPRLRRSPAGFPASPWWLTRSDRLSHPAVFAFGGGSVFGVSASPYFVAADSEKRPWKPGVQGSFFQYAGFGCDMDRNTISYTLGYENAPWFFLKSKAYFPQKPLGDNVFSLAAGEEVCCSAAVFSYPASDERGIFQAMRWVYKNWHEPPRRGLDRRETVALISNAVFEDAWMPEKNAYAGFVFDHNGEYSLRALPSISWTNGLAVAVPMLQAALRLGKDSMRTQALRCIDHIVRHSLNPANGLPYTAEESGVWSNRGWWYDRQPVPGHAAYLVGQALYLILKAYDYEKRLGGIAHPDWLSFVSGVIGVTEKSRNGDHEYPYIFSEETGAGLCYDSFSGAWCLAAAAYFCRLTGKEDFLPQLLESERHYHSAYIAHLTCYGGPLDIDKQIDSEGVLAYIRAVRWLHEMTGDENLLHHMLDALEYEFTFKFCYNSPIQVPPLSKVGWSSCGGSITSVSNPHIHPMSSSIMDELFYYVQKTQDAYVESRLTDTLRWSCQTCNAYDKEFDYGKKGWMSERFCHSEGLLTETYPDGSPASTWFALMPWACGCILEGLSGEMYVHERN